MQQEKGGMVPVSLFEEFISLRRSIRHQHVEGKRKRGLPEVESVSKGKISSIPHQTTEQPRTRKKKGFPFPTFIK